MSEEKSDQQDNQIECALCGVPGGPYPGCELCHGSNRFAQARHYTLTEERQGLNKSEEQSRYGKYGEVGPKIVNLPGSMNPYSPKTNK